MDFDQGDVVLVEVQFSDFSDKKKRPVLVLSRTDFNKGSRDLIGCGLTTNLANSEYSIPVGNKDLVTGNLDKPSLIKANHVFTMDKSIILRRLAKVKPEIVEKTKRMVQSLL